MGAAIAAGILAGIAVTKMCALVLESKDKSQEALLQSLKARIEKVRKENEK